MRKKDNICLSVSLALVVYLFAGSASAGDYYFGEPELIESLDSTGGGHVSWMSADGLTVYLESDRPGGLGSGDIWVSHRQSTDDDWGTPVNLGPSINSPSNDMAPTLSSDQLEMYFASFRVMQNFNIWVSSSCCERPNGQNCRRLARMNLSKDVTL